MNSGSERGNSKQFAVDNTNIKGNKRIDKNLDGGRENPCVKGREEESCG